MKKFLYVFLLCSASFLSISTYADQSISQQQQEQARKVAEKNQLEQLCVEGNKSACARYSQLAEEAKDNSLKLDPSFIDKFSEKFTETIDKWLPPIKKAATYLLFTLGVVSLVIRMLPLVLKGAEFGEIIKELIVFLLIIGVWYALILNAKEWTDAIIDSFAKLADLSSGSAAGTTPLTILQSGFITVGKILTSTWNPITLLMYTILSVIIIVIYAMIAFYLLKVMLETLIITYSGLLMVGFAGIAYTSDYAKRYLTYTISVGFKYYLTLLIAGFGITFINDIVNDVEFGSVGACLGVICVVALIWKLVEEIPNMAQSMVTGASIGSGNMNIGGALATMASSAAAFTAAAYAGVAAFKAANASGTAGGSSTSGVSSSTTGVQALAQGVRDSGVNSSRAASTSGVDADSNKSLPQLFREGKLKGLMGSGSSSINNTTSGSEKKSNESQDNSKISPSMEAYKAVMQSIGQGVANKASGRPGSLSQNITRAAIDNASQQSVKKPIPSPYAVNRTENKDNKK